MVQLSTMIAFIFAVLYTSPAASFMQHKLDDRSLAVRHLTPKGRRASLVSVQNFCTRAPPRSSPASLNLLFGDKVKDDQKDLLENELARFSHRLSPTENPATKFDSLSTMILEWAKLFTNEDKKMGLSTPVMLVELPKRRTGGDIANEGGVQLLFLKTKTGYADKDKMKDDESPDREEAVIKEGGVEVRVDQLVGGDLQVVASRCEVEEGTLIKEMSEQAIMDSLRKAVAAWKKEQGS